MTPVEQQNQQEVLETSKLTDAKDVGVDEGLNSLDDPEIKDSDFTKVENKDWNHFSYFEKDGKIFAKYSGTNPGANWARDTFAISSMMNCIKVIYSKNLDTKKEWGWTSFIVEWWNKFKWYNVDLKSWKTIFVEGKILKDDKGATVISITKPEEFK